MEIVKKRGPSPSIRTFLKESNDFEWGDYRTKHTIGADTDSTYVSIEAIFDKSASINDVVEFADKLGSSVNDEFPDFMESVFNVKKENNTINTDRETVSDKSFFQATKRYMMHVVDAEGERTDKYKITGLDIRKTDTSKKVKSFLERICYALIDDCDYDHMETMLESFYEEYINSTMQDIGRPMSVKVLKHYQDEYAQTGDMKGMPYHVRASIYYNTLCGPNDPKIRSGDGVSVVAITNGTLARHIAVPVDAEILPDFVNEFNVDWKDQWAGAKEKMRKYLAAVGWDRESRQKAVETQLVEF